MSGVSRNLDEIRHALQAEPAVRSAAMQNLLDWAREDASIHSEAMPIFCWAAAEETDVWSAICGARGIQLISGPAIAGTTWAALLGRQDVMFVSRVALAIDDPMHAPVLLELLATRTEIPVRASAIRTLGRLRNHDAFSPLAEQMTEQKLWPALCEAFRDLGDERAIPLVEPLLTDETPVMLQDERGAWLRLNDLANDAVRQLQANVRRANPPAPEPPPAVIPMPTLRHKIFSFFASRKI